MTSDFLTGHIHGAKMNILHYKQSWHSYVVFESVLSVALYLPSLEQPPV